MNQLIKPPDLKKGDCIGLFSPSGPIRDVDKVKAGIQVLHKMGFRTKKIKSGGPKHDYLAADDQTRLDEFHALWADREVKALMAIRGGYGCMRIVDKVNFDMIHMNPKHLIGFSDITVLLNAINSQSGLITIHGPVVSSLAESEQESIATLQSMLTGNPPSTFTADTITILRSGCARGVLRGGNLATLVHMVGTPWEVPMENTLLLLEDTGEPMYRVDRMLTQLHQSGMFRDISGVLLGTFDLGEETGKEETLRNETWNRVLELTHDIACPVWGNFPSGHQVSNHPVPFGGEAIIDSETKKLVIN